MQCLKVLKSKIFDSVLLITICVHTVCFVILNTRYSIYDKILFLVHPAQIACITIYLIEMLFKMIILGLFKGKKAYFRKL